jgi:N-acetylglucosaminyl-diphospho-decaprenol L-rhamnosyltransferase
MVALDIVIVNWNTGGQLRACLESIVPAAAAGGDLFALRRVCVVDNASADGSADGLARAELPLQIVRNPANRGFAAACNQGAAACVRGAAAADGTAGGRLAAGDPASGRAAVGGTAQRGDYLLFLNPDTRLVADSLSAPIAFMERAQNGRVGVVGIRLDGDDGEPQRACARFPSARHLISRALGLDRALPRLFPSYRMITWDHRESRFVDQVTGAFFLVRRGLFESLGGFDERFFVYLEELDFSYRMALAGWKSYYLAGARAYHRGGGASESDRGARLFYALRSRILYGFKHFEAPAAVSVLLCTLFLEPLLRTLAAVAGGSAARIGETAAAYRMLWKEVPRTVRGKRG